MFEAVVEDEVSGLLLGGPLGGPPRRASPSAWSCAKEERAVAKESASPFALFGLGLVRKRVLDSVEVCHPPLSLLGNRSIVGLVSRAMKGFAMLLRSTADRMEMLRPRLLPPLELDERLERVLRSLRLDSVRSDLEGETRPPELLGLDICGRMAPVTVFHSCSQACGWLGRSRMGEEGAEKLKRSRECLGSTG